MNLNSDINVLGSLPDWNLIHVFSSEDMNTIKEKGGLHKYTSIKTDKSVKRFEKAIKSTLLSYKNKQIEDIFNTAIKLSGVTTETRLILYWNASTNNDLLSYLNEKVYFPAFYSGRISIKKEEIEACINELKETEPVLKKWTIETIKTTSRKYLTLLTKFGLMMGSADKKIVHPYLSDKMFILFTYWIAAITDKPNLVNSIWLKYCFNEKQALLDRLLQKKFSKYFNVVYTGDKLSIEPLIPYESIYEYISQS